MSDKIISDVNGLEPGALIELFELDTTTGRSQGEEETLILRWHSGKNENLHDIVWQGDVYGSFPVEAEGFEWSGKGSIPKPTLTVANITSYLSGILDTYEDLVGSKVTRKRTFAKYLDAYCYVGGESLGGVCSGEAGGTPFSSNQSDCVNSAINGGVGSWVAYGAVSCASASGTWYANTTADNMADFANEIWYIDRKATETRTHVEFELTAAHDVAGVKLPARSVVANLCPWVYKGTECGYSGTNMFDLDNEATTNASEDACAKNFTACEKRFPQGTEMPFGGFPGVTQL